MPALRSFNKQREREHLDYVRLYFRPRTPTQYHNEGIRPKDRRGLGGAHCPVPIFFCFDALDILSRDDTEYSNGNMGSNAVEYGKDFDFFRQIPFAYVFHEGQFPQEYRDLIVFHRHAEVLVPKRLHLLPALRFVACRTVAERQTLLHLLPINLQKRWASQIRIADLDLFERKWTFVEEVVVVDNIVTFRFNPSTRIPGPFHVKITYRDSASGDESEWQGQISSLNDTWKVRIPNATVGEVTLYLDDVLAFSDTLIFEDLPF